MQNEQTEARQFGDSPPKGYTSHRGPRPLGVGRTVGLETAC